MIDDMTKAFAQAEAAQAGRRETLVNARAHEARQREDLAGFRAALAAPSHDDLAHIATVESRIAATATWVEAMAAEADAADRHRDALWAQRGLTT